MKKGRIEIGLAIFVLFTAMWDPWISGIVAVAALACLALYRYRTDAQSSVDSSASAQPHVNQGNPAQMHAKWKHFDEILAYARGKESVTNDEIEALLGVSDATAERYLNELEGKGKLRQVGTTGRNVSYTLK